MRKKDYELIGAAIKSMHFVGDNHHEQIANRLAEYLAKDPKFDRQKFLTACGIEHEHYGETDQHNNCAVCGMNIYQANGGK